MAGFVFATRSVVTWMEHVLLACVALNFPRPLTFQIVSDRSLVLFTFPINEEWVSVPVSGTAEKSSRFGDSLRRAGGGSCVIESTTSLSWMSCNGIYIKWENFWDMVIVVAFGVTTWAW